MHKICDEYNDQQAVENEKSRMISQSLSIYWIYYSWFIKRKRKIKKGNWTVKKR